MLCLWLLVGIVLLWGRAADGQPVDSMRVEKNDITNVASFANAQSLAATSDGRLYVADAGTDAVVVLDTLGTRLRTLGGAGTGAGSFNAPSDVEPTNGLTLLVADAGNGRIQRFTDEGRFIESLPVGEIDERSGGGRPTFDRGEDAPTMQADGRPIAVVSTSANETRAIDAAAGVVRMWDAARRPDGVIGGFGQRAGALGEPVSLALDAQNRLYVADRDLGAVLVYDRFGTYRTTLPARPDVRAVGVRGDRVYVVSPGRIEGLDTMSHHVVQVWAGAGLDRAVDAAMVRGRLYVLTPTRLLRVARSGF